MLVGNLKKMRTSLEDVVQYSLDFDQLFVVNERIGNSIRIEWTGIINCVKCSKVTKSSFGEGFCYSCFTLAPEAADCILRPELCRAHLGEGRDIEWEEANHNQPHVVYLAQSSAVKIGITRETQVPTRWIDQGATAAIRLAEVPNRYTAGMIEVALKSIFTDKTNWQKMLRNEIDESIDLVETKWELEEQLPSDIMEYFSENDEVIEIPYPVDKYPEKVKSIGLDKFPVIEGILSGIKGQYLIFDDGRVFNVRKHAGYAVQIS